MGFKKFIIMLDIVLIFVLDPLKRTETNKWYKTTRQKLEKLNKFKEWFAAVDICKDYIEIGDNGFLGVSNLTLFCKDQDNEYRLFINCEKYAHDLGMYNPPIISNILDYLDNLPINFNTPQRECLFNDCLKFLK
jgi:hypothetical protein